MGISGCETTSPISHIPSVIYYHAGNETRMYVSGDDMFDCINISINGTSRVENYTYGMMSATNLTSFQLEILVCDREGDDEDSDYQWYTYSAMVRVEPDDDHDYDDVRFYLVDIHDDKEVSRQAPHKTLMEKVQ